MDLNNSFECHFYDQLQGPNVTLEKLILQLDQKVKLFSKPVLIGHSWGGVLATEFVLKFPEKIGGIVIMCSALSNAQWVGYHKELKEMGLEGARPDKIFLVPDDLDSGREFLDATWTTFSEETFDNLNNIYIKNFDLTKRLKEIQSFNPSIINYQIPKAGHFPFLQLTGKNKIFQILRDSF